jgi:hypothetical protein
MSLASVFLVLNIRVHVDGYMRKERRYALCADRIASCLQRWPYIRVGQPRYTSSMTIILIYLEYEWLDCNYVEVITFIHTRRGEACNHLLVPFYS